MIDLTSDLAVFIFGIGATILFLIGYGLTIKEFQEMEDERKNKKNKKAAE